MVQSTLLSETKQGVTAADCMTSCLFWDESDWGITTHVMHVKFSERINTNSSLQLKTKQMCVFTP